MVPQRAQSEEKEAIVTIALRRSGIETEKSPGNANMEGERVRIAPGNAAEKTRTMKTKRWNEKITIGIDWHAAFMELRGRSLTESEKTRGNLTKDEIRETVREVRREVTRGNQQRAKPGVTTGGNSWAEVAAGNAQCAHSKQTSLDAQNDRKRREIIVRLTDEKERQTLQGKGSDHIARKIAVRDRKAADAISMARRMPSGDVAITANSEEAKELLCRTAEWTKALGESATILKRIYPVLMHGVRISFNAGNPEAAAAALMADNSKKHPGIMILKARWLTSNVGTSTKSHTSLVVDLTEEHTAEQTPRSYSATTATGLDTQEEYAEKHHSVQTVEAAINGTTAGRQRDYIAKAEFKRNSEAFKERTACKPKGGEQSTETPQSQLREYFLPQIENGTNPDPDQMDLSPNNYNTHKRLNPVQAPLLADTASQGLDIIAIQEQGRAPQASTTMNSERFYLVTDRDPQARTIKT
ncbi:MAG: hypothetical protein MMC33_007260 [Icmadophila ericetorum]|nr:hypothetical protein [Icmadophila ericetorum]